MRENNQHLWWPWKWKQHHLSLGTVNSSAIANQKPTLCKSSTHFLKTLSGSQEGCALVLPGAMLRTPGLGEVWEALACCLLWRPLLARHSNSEHIKRKRLPSPIDSISSERNISSLSLAVYCWELAALICLQFCFFCKVSHSPGCHLIIYCIWLPCSSNDARVLMFCAGILFHFSPDSVNLVYPPEPEWDVV